MNELNNGNSDAENDFIAAPTMSDYVTRIAYLLDRYEKFTIEGFMTWMGNKPWASTVCTSATVSDMAFTIDKCIKVLLLILDLYDKKSLNTSIKQIEIVINFLEQILRCNWIAQYCHKGPGMVLDLESGPEIKLEEVVDRARWAYKVCDELRYDLIFSSPIVTCKDIFLENVLNQFKNAQEELQNIKEDLTEKQKIVKNKCKELQDGFIELGSNSLAHYFNRQAKEHDCWAKCWLGWYILSMIGLAVYLGWVFHSAFYSSLYNLTNNFQLIAIITAKVLALTAISSVVFFVSRNYKANKHQYIISRYRENLLKTVEYLMMVDNGQKEYKLALLSAAFNAVCSEKASGYVTTEDVEQSHGYFDPISMVQTLQKLSK